MASIIDSLFGPTPYDVGQARNQQDMSYAEKVARMGGFEQAKFGIGQGAAGLTRAGAGMMGMVDPLQQEAAMREQVMGMGGDLTTSAGLLAAYSLRFSAWSANFTLASSASMFLAAIANFIAVR